MRRRRVRPVRRDDPRRKGRPAPVLAAVGVLVAGLLATAGCDAGPEGPGTLGVVASGPELGAVVLEVEGPGIRGFAARGSARVYSAPVEGRADAHRVIVIDPEPGELSFAVEVDDVGMEGPVVTVVSAADGDNLGMSASRVTVRIAR